MQVSYPLSFQKILCKRNVNETLSCEVTSMSSYFKQNSPDSVFSAYRKTYVEMLRQMGEEYVLPKGKMMQQKDLYYLLEGKCALCIHGTEGEELSLIYFYPGRLLNFLPSLNKYYPLQHITNKRRVPLQSFVVRAVTDCRFLRIASDIFIKNYISSIELHSLIVQSLIENVYSLFSHSFNSPKLPVYQRICRLLLEIMNDTPPHTLQRHITYAEISTHLSIHTVTVAKVFKALRQAEIISRDMGNVTVINPNELRRIAEGKQRLPYKSV